MRSHVRIARIGRRASCSRNCRRQTRFMPKSASAMNRVQFERSRNRSKRCISSTASSGVTARHDVSRFARSMQNAQSYGQPLDR
jgi:hypothetical protein